VGYLFANFIIFLGLSVLHLGPMYATDVRQTDRQTDVRQGRSDGGYIGIYTPKISLP